MSTSMGSVERHMEVGFCRPARKKYVATKRSGYIREEGV